MVLVVKLRLDAPGGIRHSIEQKAKKPVLCLFSVEHETVGQDNRTKNRLFVSGHGLGIMLLEDI